MLVGYYVRDKANRGGKVETLWYDWAGVRWNDGTSSWIKIKWLTVEPIVLV